MVHLITSDSWKTFSCYLIIVVFSTTFYPFMNDNAIDYFQLFVMVVMSCSFLMDFKIFRDDIPFWILIFLLTASSWINGFSKVISLFYGILFVFTFFQYKHLLYKKCMSAYNYRILLKRLVYAYFIVIIIQQFSKIIGAPILNGLSFYTDDFRFNSLSNEPSHSSIILMVIMISYIYMSKIVLGKEYQFKMVYGEDRILWFAYFYALLTSGSSTAFLVVPVTMCYFINCRSFFIALSGILFICYLSITYIDNPAFERIQQLLPSLLSLDPELIALADLSGASRINPVIYYIQDFNINSLNTWIGLGRGYSEPMLMERVLGHETDAVRGSGGIFPILFYDYGLMCGLFFLYYYCFNKNCRFFIVLWICFFYSADLNTYLQWIYITLAFTTGYFYKHAIEIIPNNKYVTNSN